MALRKLDTYVALLTTAYPRWLQTEHLWTDRDVARLLATTELGGRYWHYLSQPQWQALAFAVRETFGNRCAVCVPALAHQPIETAHKLYPVEPYAEFVGEGLSHTELVALCERHHTEHDAEMRSLWFADIDALREAATGRLLAARWKEAVQMGAAEVVYCAVLGHAPKWDASSWVRSTMRDWLVFVNQGQAWGLRVSADGSVETVRDGRTWADAQGPVTEEDVDAFGWVWDSVLESQWEAAAGEIAAGRLDALR